MWVEVVLSDGEFNETKLGGNWVWEARATFPENSILTLEDVNFIVTGTRLDIAQGRDPALYVDIEELD
jgi:hypothetical protein